MTKTAAQLADAALHEIGVAAADIPAQGHDVTSAVNIWEGQHAEINASHGFGWAWGFNAVPDALFRPLTLLLASEIAPTFAMQGPNRARALTRLRAIAFTDDRSDPRDLDEDGTVSTDEAAAGKRAAFF